jgi:DNA repair photolyase
MAGDGEVLSLNLVQGCVHRCPFCSARGYRGYVGDEVVYAYAGTAERLAAELSARRSRPRAVFVCPSTDPFPPIAAIQEEAARVVDVLASHGVQAWLMTRGYIQPAVLEVLAANHAWVKVTLALTTLDRRLQRVLEPLTAPPRLRLRQIVQLRELGIGVQPALLPLLPGLTDTRDNLRAVLAALADRGVRQVTAGYLFLRPGIADNLARALHEHGWDELLLSAFEDGPVLKGNGLAAARYLPKARRQRGYAALTALASEYGITVTICATTNPDFASPQRAEAVEPPRLAARFAEACAQLKDQAASLNHAV